MERVASQCLREVLDESRFRELWHTCLSNTQGEEEGGSASSLFLHRRMLQLAQKRFELAGSYEQKPALIYLTASYLNLARLYALNGKSLRRYQYLLEICGILMMHRESRHLLKISKDMLRLVTPELYWSCRALEANDAFSAWSDHYYETLDMIYEEGLL